MTLVFSVAISGDLYTFLNEMGEPRFHYRPQFNKGEAALDMEIHGERFL